MDTKEINQTLAHKSPQEIVHWAVHRASDNIIISSNFRPQEAVLLHMAVQAKPNIPVLFADSGYNTRDTYKHLVALKEQLKLNLKIYSPMTTLGYRDVVYGGIPGLHNPEEHDRFTEEVKLEPFNRGLKALDPRYWLTALRKDQTEFRQNLDIVTIGKSGVIKVCPVLYWTNEQMNAYLEEHNLPSENNYFDPTKVLEKRECGLHPNF